MGTTKTEPTTASGPRALTPAEIGLMVKTFRTMHSWTQETLAELSGLQTRTIQRVEQGQPSNAHTRRALARAFAIDDLDYFSALISLPTGEQAQEQKEAFDRDNLVLDARVVDGRQLLTLMQEGPGFGGMSAMSVAELPHGAQDAFATIVDFVRDCIDVFDVASTTEILRYGDTLNETIAELKKSGFCLSAAFRDVKLTGRDWVDKTPLPCRITYFLASPVDQPATKIAVPRKVSMGF